MKVHRGLIKEEKLEVDYVVKEVGGITVRMPHQAFINNEFIDGASEKTYQTINPADESVSAYFFDPYQPGIGVFQVENLVFRVYYALVA